MKATCSYIMLNVSILITIFVAIIDSFVLTIVGGMACIVWLTNFCIDVLCTKDEGGQK
jgi:hypothetical protein